MADMKEIITAQAKKIIAKVESYLRYIKNIVSFNQ